jgi:hypothetical protein
MSEDYKFQLSMKYGPHDSAMINMRANEWDELTQAVDKAFTFLAAEGNSFDELARELKRPPASVQEAEAALQAGGFQQVQPQPPEWLAQGQRQAQAAQGTDGPPRCAHGPMKDLAHKGYKSRWYCSGPFNLPREQKCPPMG